MKSALTVFVSVASVAVCLLASACSVLGQDEKARWDTDIPESEAFDADFAAWGPDGERIVFQHTGEPGSPDPGNYDQLWIADLEAGTRRMIFPGRVLVPDLSPSGEWVVFHTKTFPQHLFKVDTSGMRLTRLTGPDSPNPALGYAVTGEWSPNGDRLLYALSAGEPRGISIMRPDGTGARILARYGVNGSWFPDGQRIVYVNWNTSQEEDRRQIYIADTDGSKERRLTGLSDSDLVGWPAVSPDGEQIAFVHRGRDRSKELYLMDADGTNARQVSEMDCEVQRPDWHPRGGKILFSCRTPLTINAYARAYALDSETLEIEPVFPKKETTTAQ